MKHFLVAVVLAVVGQSAGADVVYCRFESNFKPSTFVRWNTTKNTMYVESGWPRRKDFYTDVSVYPIPLGPYQGKSKALSAIIFGDVPALHIRKTFNGKILSDRDRTFPYEAYLGDIPGRVDGMWNGAYGVRGACWTKRLPGSVKEGGERHTHGRDCGHSRGGGRGKGGERGGGNNR